MKEILTATNLTNVTFTEPYAEVQTGFEEMCASVKEYGGFYIARYEAGIDDSGSGISTYASEAPTNYNIVSKKGAAVYNCVPWVDSEEGQKGAVTLSKEMAENNNYDASVVSTLCYGVQWDAVMKFVNDSEHDIYSSASWGNYSDSSSDTGADINSGSSNMNYTTGRNEAWQAKNIYDLAGNVWEWTMEEASATYKGTTYETRAIRGGGYYVTGSNCPAAIRVNDVPIGASDSVGFRPTLYIK